MIVQTLDTLAGEIECCTLGQIPIGPQAKCALLILAGIHPTFYNSPEANTSSDIPSGLDISSVFTDRLRSMGIEHLLAGILPGRQRQPSILACRDLFALNVQRLNDASSRARYPIQMPNKNLQTVVVTGLQNTAFALKEKRKYNYASDKKIFRKKEDELAGIIKGGLVILMDRLLRKCSITVRTDGNGIMDLNPASLFNAFAQADPFGYDKYRPYLGHDLIFHGDTILNRVHVFPPLVKL